MENILWYKEEATAFEEALPIGNGILGGMVYGKCDVEKISLNSDTLWSGTDEEPYIPENAYSAYKKAQVLINEGKIIEAEKLLEKEFNSMPSQIYMPLGNMFIDFGHENVICYKRNLDLKTATARTEYVHDGIKYEREYIAADEGIVLHITADKKASVSFCVGFASELKINKIIAEDGILRFYGECPAYGCNREELCDGKYLQYFDDKKGIEFTGAIKVLAENGDVECCDGKVYVKNADSADLYFCTENNYCDESNSLVKNDEYIIKNEKNLKSFTSYEDILKNHQKAYGELYNRVSLNLGTGCKNDIDTKERVMNFNGEDLGLIELMFNFGRYLLIAGSKPGSQAMNLQGIWNEELLPPWASNYTVNINTEMNYWPAFNCNLAECFEPMIGLAKKISKTGERTAKEYYHGEGFVAHHNLDLWGYTCPVGIERDRSSVYAFWNMSSGWISCQLFDCYEYTKDEKKLREEIYPIMKKATEFYLSVLEEDEKGKLIITPSTSPENSFLAENGEWRSVAKTATMTVSILRELISRVIKCCRILNTDKEFCDKLADTYEKLAEIKINPDGRLSEWIGQDEFIEAEPEHRHVSNLYSLYPGNHISLSKTPELADACRKSLIARSNEGTGWSIAWKTNLWAMLGDGEQAFDTIKTQMKYCKPGTKLTTAKEGGTYPNLFDAHPPFQIDGNFGLTAGIANMLMQSEEGEIKLLPALPKSWKSGEVRGLIAKGDIEVGVVWENSELKEFMLKSKSDCMVSVYYKGEKTDFELLKNEIKLIS